MKTCYIRFCQAYTDPVWGLQAIPWSHTQLIRVTRNRLQRAQIEWVGNAGAPMDFELLRKNYPIAMMVPECPL